MFSGSIVSTPETPRSRCSKVLPVRLTSLSKNCRMWPCLAALKASKIRSKPSGQADGRTFGTAQPLKAPNDTSSYAIGSKYQMCENEYVKAYSFFARRLNASNDQPYQERHERSKLKKPHSSTKIRKGRRRESSEGRNASAGRLRWQVLPAYAKTAPKSARGSISMDERDYMRSHGICGGKRRCNERIVYPANCPQMCGARPWRLHVSKSLSICVSLNPLWRMIAKPLF